MSSFVFLNAGKEYESLLEMIGIKSNPNTLDNLEKKYLEKGFRSYNKSRVNNLTGMWLRNFVRDQFKNEQSFHSVYEKLGTEKFGDLHEITGSRPKHTSTRLKNFTEKLVNKESLIENRDSAISKLKSKIETYELLISNRDSAISELKSKIETYERLISNRNEAIEAIKFKVDVRDQLIANREEIIVDLRKKIRTEEKN